MSENEEYLDNLLKSMGREEVQEPKEDKAASMMSLEEIEAMFAEAEKQLRGMTRNRKARSRSCRRE